MDEKIKSYLIVVSYDTPARVMQLDGENLKKALLKQAVSASLMVANRMNNHQQLMDLTEILGGL